MSQSIGYTSLFIEGALCFCSQSHHSWSQPEHSGFDDDEIELTPCSTLTLLDCNCMYGDVSPMFAETIATWEVCRPVRQFVKGEDSLAS
jgi:hypothetical protein